MPGLVPGIHVFPGTLNDVDGRDEPGHDGAEIRWTSVVGSFNLRLPSLEAWLVVMIMN